MRFWKYEGLGNDFVLVREVVDGPLAAALCDRSFGVGADGVLAVRGSPGEATVVVWNSDGSQAEICGNGLRCVTLHLVELEGASSPVTLGTGAGKRRCSLIALSAPGVAEVEVAMGQPSLERSAVPVLGGPGSSRMVDEPVEVLGRTLRLTAVGMGNPHAVTFDPVDAAEVTSLGPALEGHELFPAKVNAGFAAMTGETELTLTVWERGAGLTGACGSGACAAVVAACETGRAERDRAIRVTQPGGTLSISVSSSTGEITMTGPARRVFVGELDVGAFRPSRDLITRGPAPR